MERFLWIAAFFAAVLQIWFAYGTSFWCDELGWIFPASGSLRAFLRWCAQEPTFHGPLTPVVGTELARLLIALHVHPHIAFRALSLFFYVGTALVPSFCGLRWKWSWFLLSSLSIPAFAFSLSNRPYIDVLFFVTCAFSYFFLYLKGRGNRDGPPWWLSFFIVLGGASFPFIGISTILSIACILAVKPRWRWIFPLALSLAVMIAWQKGFHAPMAFRPSGLHETARRISAFRWGTHLLEALHVLVGPGTSFKAVFVFLLAGMVSLWRQDKRFSLFVIAAFFCGLCVPLFLDAVYGYFFAPRQTLVALPSVLFALAAYFHSLSQKRGVGRFFIGAISLWFCVAMPWLHFLKTQSPYVDVPRHRLLPQLPRLTENGEKTLVVYSSCHLPSACVYSSEEAFSQFTRRFASRAGQAECAEKRGLQLWTRSEKTCFGEYVDKPDDLALGNRIRSDPGRYVFLWPQGMRRPQDLKSLPCIDETGHSCAE